MATRSLNRVQLIGNLTRDTEMRYTSSGTPIATFTVATNRSYRDSSGNDIETAEFTNVVAWAKLAEICGQLLKKGMKVFIEGRLQTNKWDDKETGKQMQRTEVVISDMIILTPAGSGSSSHDDGSAGSSQGQPVQDNSKQQMGEDVNFEELQGDDVEDKNDKKEKLDDSSGETPF